MAGQASRLSIFLRGYGSLNGKVAVTAVSVFASLCHCEGFYPEAISSLGRAKQSHHQAEAYVFRRFFLFHGIGVHKPRYTIFIFAVTQGFSLEETSTLKG